MKGQDAIESLKRKFRITSDAALARRLGITHMSLLNWKRRPSVTARQTAGLVGKACAAAAKRAEAAAVRPVVEFFPIAKTESRQGARYELFSIEADDGGTHPYLSGLQDELESRNGVYVFFDSRGQALYVGKARKQSLWSEMTSAFNRGRGDLQTIRRVKHPERRQEYRTSDEKARQIVAAVVPLHELATYFSAYEVSSGLIEELEAMLVRCAANDLLNKKMERFGQQRRAARRR
jgi:hypothetical protein